VPLGAEHVPTGIHAGLADGWGALAFDVRARTDHGAVPAWAVTAVGRATTGQPFRLHPRRLGRFTLGPRLPAVALPPSLRERWTAAGDPSASGLVVSSRAAAALLATDDGDEIWATGTALAALRPDGHRPDLLEHHLRLLTTIVRDLAPRDGC